MNIGAKRLGLDKFKMKSQDKDKTVFQHPAGHTITVAHNSLSKDLQEQLMTLGKSAKDARTPQNIDEEKHKMADGGEVGDGSSYEKEHAEQSDREQQRRSVGASDATGPLVSETMEKGLQKKYPTQVPIKQYAQGTPDAPIGNEKLDDSGVAPVGTPDPNQPMFDIPPEEQTPEYQQQQLQTPATNSMLNEPQNKKIIEENGYQVPPMAQESQPQEQESQPQDQVSPAAAPAQHQPEAAPEQKAPTPEQHAAKVYHDENNDMLQENEKFKNDLLTGHIQPKTYSDFFHDKSTLNKIGTIFAMAVAGLGSGLTGQKNPVLGMMDQLISNDLDAQKKSADNAQNYYKLNNDSVVQHAQAKGLNIDTRTKAYNLKKMQDQEVALQYLVDQSKKYTVGTPQYQAAQQQLAFASDAVQQSNADLANKSAAASAKMNLMTGLNGGAPGQSSDDATVQRINFLRATGNEPMAKALEEKFVPGVGTAKISVPQAVREDLISHEKLNNAAQDVLDFSKHNTNLIPGTPSYNTGVQKSVVLQQMVREGLLGTVFRESEKPLLQQVVDTNPAGVFKLISTQPKLKALIESNIQQANTTKKFYGLPQQAQQQQSQSNQVKTLNGVQYQKVPGGWQKVK